MVMYARKQPRLNDGCHDRRESQPYQTLKYPSKSHTSSSEHRHDKTRESGDPSPPCKMLRRSNSPENKHSDSTGHSKSKSVHAHRARERDGGTSYSPQDNSHNNSTHHSSNSHHSSNPSNNPSKTSDAPYEPADDWSEHISSSGKKYYYNCRTEVSQWEKPKEWIEREQRQKEASKVGVVNSFPRDRDYRRETLQATATSGFTSGKTAPVDKSASHACATSSSSSGMTPAASQTSSATTSTVPVSPVPQSPIPPLLQDPNLLRQLLPALQATLQLNNANVDMSKINEVLTAAVTQASLQSMLHKLLTAGPSALSITTLLSQAAQLSSQAQQSNQSPMSLASDASSPRSYVSPRISTPQTNTVPLKPLMSTPPVSNQPKSSTPIVKQGPAQQQVSQQPVAADKHGHEPESPRNVQRSSSQRSPSPSPNHIASSSATSSASSVQPTTSARSSCSLTPTLAAHFNENLIKHVQGWPADHAEKQASRLREEAHNMGSIHISEICTELKNLRSLVRVCEIQATLREQRILFLRQQIKELEKLKNQNSFMV
ncbi:WW domain-containing adapter protein with coiled-coil isoform X3 [Callorhinchus milii]|uniref:WW domain-containing adapter protein with coiled-coil n=1 Tax=Callorhinchus milii TaxID=7868 RepID=K4FV12_CALMI|nr:WW domain-containing adapter protein with coiled-coil isoform X3 [Callorhinchus milii]AFK11529.1 WW domain-containing adapter protein with coiled-coil-like isoform 2 [Callorhinchus milii]